MKPKPAKVRDVMNRIYPNYSVAELAWICGMSQVGMRDYLKRMGLVQEMRKGVKIYIMLTDIQNMAPQFFDSILEACQLNLQIESKQQEALEQIQTEESTY